MKSVSWTSIQCIFYFHFARTNVIMIKIACNHLSWCVFMAFSRIPKFILLFCVQSQSSNIPCLSTPYFMPCLALQLDSTNLSFPFRFLDSALARLTGSFRFSLFSLSFRFRISSFSFQTNILRGPFSFSPPFRGRSTAFISSIPQNSITVFFVSFLDSFLQTPSSSLLNPSSYHTLPSIFRCSNRLQTDTPRDRREKQR